MAVKYKLHECERLPKTGVQIIGSKGSSDRPGFVWHLELTREATEEDLEENNCLDEVGEILWSLAAEITHCPYCGTGLYGKNQPDFEDHGRFDLIDCSGWSVKRR